MNTLKKCPICEASQFMHFSVSKDYTVSQELFNLVSCTQCHFVFTNPHPNAEEIPNYYKSDAYISHTSNAKNLVDRIYLFVRRFTLNWKLSIIKAEAASNPSILDVGCGTGDFLKVCKSNGYTVSGVETDEHARKLAESNIQIKIYDRLDDIPEKSKNVITLWHVLEHVPDVNLCISQLKEKLHHDGVIILAVPNYKSYDASFYKEHWAAFDVPRHLWHFSRETMNRLLTKHQLTIRKVIPMKLDAYYVSMLSEKYQGKNKSIFGMISAFIKGYTSNNKASSTGEYSSLIYIVTNDAKT